MKIIGHPLQPYNYVQIVEERVVSTHCLPCDLCKENKTFRRNSGNSCLLHGAREVSFLLVLPLKATESHREGKLTYADFTLFLEAGFEWLESSRILDKFRFNLYDLDAVQPTYRQLGRQLISPGFISARKYLNHHPKCQQLNRAWGGHPPHGELYTFRLSWGDGSF